MSAEVTQKVTHNVTQLHAGDCLTVYRKDNRKEKREENEKDGQPLKDMNKDCLAGQRASPPACGH
jgi:hypothetical protein